MMGAIAVILVADMSAAMNTIDMNIETRVVAVAVAEAGTKSLH